MKRNIQRVGIIGAGTMGAGIAAHLANVGINVVLLDIVTPGLSDSEIGEPAARNRLVTTLFSRMKKSRPASLATPDKADLIQIGNIEDDFNLLSECDWIIEVIIEKLQPKQALMERVEGILKEGAIVSSNTSGIPIASIAEGRSERFRASFLGTHFFNPPRYLKLLELIPGPDTDAEVLDFMFEFGTNVLGKGAIICKDTPNFIANRFIAVAGSHAVEYAFQNGYSVAEVDALSGPIVGRPKTGTFRLTDLVGIDVMSHVSQNLYPLIEDDPYRENLKGEKSSRVNSALLERGWLGNKSEKGFYTKKMVDGKREFWVLNPETLEHEPAPKVRFESIGAVRKIGDLGKRLKALLAYDDRAANFIRETLYFNLAYAAFVTPEIAFSIRDVDLANKWGFAHDAGPFEIWDMLGVAETVKSMQTAGFTVADWVLRMLNSGKACFYSDGSYYDFVSGDYVPSPIDKARLDFTIFKNSGGEVERNESASLIDIGDGVVLLEMHAPKINAVDADFISMTSTSLERLDSDFDALVVANEAKDFCIGANIALLGIAAAQGLWDQVEEMIHTGQKVFYDLRHASKPVVTAPHQRVLGGGVELTMSGWASVADHETYLGLVEVGVGLVPAWGGCKESLRRRVNPIAETENGDVMPALMQVFQNIATARVSMSAWEAKQIGYLRKDDVIVMNSDHRIARAKAMALGMVNSGVRPPAHEKIYAAGRDARAALMLGAQSFSWSGYATDHELKMARRLAHILTGGDLSAPAWVDPWYILDLEREAILSLAGEQLTQDRIMHMLQTGRPLRN